MTASSVPLATRRFTWALIGAYFTLRIGLLAGTRVYMESPPPWIDQAFEVGAYLLAAIAISVNLPHLETFNIDLMALILIVVGMPLHTVLVKLHLPFPYSPPVDFSIAYVPIAIGLLAWLVSQRSELKVKSSPKVKHILAAFVGGLSVAVVTGLLIRWGSGTFPGIHATLPQLVLLAIYQYTYAALAEEPFFRGFLWGALRQSGFSPQRTFLIQAVLFWIAHLYYLKSFPVSFWLIVPMGAILMGLLVWASRSISTSIVAHGLMNGVGQAVAYYRL